MFASVPRLPRLRSSSIMSLRARHPCSRRTDACRLPRRRKAVAFAAVLYRLMKMRCNVGRQQHRPLSAAVAFPRSCVCAQSSVACPFPLLSRTSPVRCSAGPDLREGSWATTAPPPQPPLSLSAVPPREESSGVRVVAGGSLALRVLPSLPRARGPQAGAIWRLAPLWIIPAALEASSIASFATQSASVRCVYHPVFKEGRTWLCGLCWPRAGPRYLPVSRSVCARVWCVREVGSANRQNGLWRRLAGDHAEEHAARVRAAASQ